MNHRLNTVEAEADGLITGGGVADPGSLQLRNSADFAIASAAQMRLMSAAKRPRRGRRKETEDPYYGPGFHLEETLCGVLDPNVDALITRNHYGCLVLNAAHALFIDVDMFLPDDIYNPAEERDKRMEPARQRVLSDLRSVLENKDEYGFRIYRTAGGFRILATTHEFEPESDQADRLMKSVGADTNFVELCRRQRNFRARLTPKPWRCNLHRPPNFFPRKNARAEKRFQKWLMEYDRACESRATCEYVGHVGRDFVHERIGRIIEFHDRATNALSSLPLA